jgi:hypothetical protein
MIGKIALGALGLVAVVAAIGLQSVVPVPQAAAPQRDANAVCGPAMTAKVDAFVRRELLKPVNFNWHEDGAAMFMDLMFSQGQNAVWVKLRCDVRDGKPIVGDLQVRRD